MPAYAPQSTFRTFLGVAKDTINANLSATYASTTTSFVLLNAVGTPTSSMSMVIVDGPLTETLVVSSWTNGTSTLVTTSGSVNAHSANVYVYFQTTSSIGPTAYIPVTKLDYTDTYDQLYDKGYRGSQALEYGAQQGQRIGGFSLEGDLFADSFGYILGSFFGAYDYTGTSGGSPTTYAFSPNNTGNGQPPSYLFYFYNPGGSNCRVMAKAVVSDMAIKFDPKALIQWTCSGMGFATGVVATPTPSYSSFTPVAARVGATTIGGTYNPDLESAEFTFKREEFDVVNTIQGIQDPLSIFSGPVSLNTKWTMTYADDTQLNEYINETQPSFDVTAVKGATTAQNGIEIHCHEANYDAVKPTFGKAWVELDGSFHGIANTSDASTAGTGYSPALVTLSVGTNTGATKY